MLKIVIGLAILLIGGISRADDIADYTGHSTRDPEMSIQLFCQYQSASAMEAALARDRHASIANTMQAMTEVYRGDANYLQARSADILANVYYHPEMGAADLGESERKTCIKNRGFVLGFSPW